MDPDTLIIVALGLGLTVLATLPTLLRREAQERRTRVAHAEAIRYGLHEPVSLHPMVDPGGCIGTSNCVSVCPEEVLGLRAGQAVAVSPARCIGHGLCERICPVDAIQLVFGSEKRGVDLPRVRENFETNVPGLYVIGELGGMGLVANAFEQGRQCVEGIVREMRGDPNRPPGLDDLIVVGCGPAGLSASLTALQAGLRFTTLEREDLGGTVRHYPRKKLVMTRPVKVPGYGKLPMREVRKEELIEMWEEIAVKAGLQVETGMTVTGVERLGPLHFKVATTDGVRAAKRVVLAIGRRGVPRKLGVPGEDQAAHVAYALREPEAYRDDRILVVGGGDSAVEAALALAGQPGNQVRLSYRGEAFSRIKPANHQRLESALSEGALEVLLQTRPNRILPADVTLARTDGQTWDVPADQVFVFIGGELPTGFLRAAGVEIETHFGAP
jgi:thioredoxin reductase (NADPH)